MLFACALWAMQCALPVKLKNVPFFDLMKQLGLIVNIFLVFAFSNCGYTQSQEKIYSVMMMNFSKGIHWPAEAVNGNLIIGVLEYPPLAAELINISSNNRLAYRKVEVREYMRVEDIDKCHILFIPAYKAKKLPDVLAHISRYPTLIVTNKPDLARKGAGINFVLLNGKLKFEINSRAIEKRGMMISSDLKGLGILVE
jgi:hypothetical protein